MSLTQSAAEIAESLARAAEHRRRPDLASRLRAGLERQARPETIVCFVGEFKQGKSSLVNALLEANVCPVHDDIATAVPTVIRFGESTEVIVHLTTDGRSTAKGIEPAELAEWVDETQHPDHDTRADYVEIAVDHPLLKQGLVLVDTPGVGGISSGHARAATAFLPYSDALVFVTDASAELSAAEIGFLTEAADLCPLAVVVLSKTDLYPAWRQIAQLDAGHLQEASCNSPVIETSASALAAAIQLDDTNLADESGIPSLREFLTDDVLDSGRNDARARLLSDCIAVLDHLEPGVTTEISILKNPASAESVRAQYEEVTQRLSEVRDSASRWHQVLNDGVTDLSSEMSFRFRSDIRRLNEELGPEIEHLRTPEQWDDLALALQHRVANLTTKLFADIDERTDALAQRVGNVLRDDLGFSSPSKATARVDLIIRGLDPPKPAASGTRTASSAMGAMRGAQSGILLFGMLGRYLPMGAAAILFSNPVTLVLGAAFAGKQVRTVRSQNLALRRQQARTSVRVFLDKFQHEATNRLSEVMRDQSRALRDHYTERATELQTSARAIAEQAHKDLTALESERAAKLPALMDESRELSTLRAAIGRLRDQLETHDTPALAPRSTPGTADAS